MAALGGSASSRMVQVSLITGYFGTLLSILPSCFHFKLLSFDHLNVLTSNGEYRTVTMGIGALLFSVVCLIPLLSFAALVLSIVADPDLEPQGAA
jgi:hypothetical protein